VGVRVGVEEQYISVKIFYSSIKTADLGGLWALEWAWHIAETILRCAKSSGICMSNS